MLIFAAWMPKVKSNTPRLNKMSALTTPKYFPATSSAVEMGRPATTS